jgi:hypothetical protein
MPPRARRLLATSLLAIAAAALPAGAGVADTVLWRSPVIGARASRDWAGLRFWASGAGFSVGRRAAGYGVQGGAAVPLGNLVDLTASYRLTGFSTGDRLGGALDDVDERTGAPFLGLSIDF